MFKRIQYKHWLATCWLTSALFFANAQTIWNKTYVEDRPTMLFGAVIQNNQSYSVIGVTTGYPNNQAKGFIGEIDNDGNIANYVSMGDSVSVLYGLFWNTLIRNSQSGLVFTGYRIDTARSILLAIASSDSLNEYTYTTPQTSAFQGYNILQYNSNYYIAGVRTDSLTNNADILLMKIDSAGNRLWERYYNRFKRDYAVKVIRLNNDNLMLGAFRTDLNNTNERANTWLLEVDTGGQIIRQWFDPNDSTYAAEGLLQTQDGGFIYGAQKRFEQTVGGVYKTATIVRLDSNFNKEWVFEGGVSSSNTGIKDIEFIDDTTYIACGNYTNGQAWVIKFTDSGIILWEKKYKGLQPSGTWNILKDIDVLPDGSFIAAGYCEWLINPNNNPPQVGWLLKLDSTGCEMESCLVGLPDDGQQLTDHGQLQVYPNPFTSDLSIALISVHVSVATYTITNLTGQTVYQQTEANLATGYTKTLDLSYLPNGVYFVEVSTGEGKIVKRIIKQ